MKDGWTYRKLGEIASIKSGYTPSSSDLMDCGNIPYFKVGDMNNVGNEKYLQHSLSYVNDTFKSFPQGSIVFPKNGAAIATNKKRILKQSSVVDLNTAVLIPNQKENVEFLYYWICNVDFRNITRRGAVPTLDTKTLMKLDVPYITHAEQERIVAELDLLSSIIEKKKAQLKEYDKLAQSIFYDMFGDPITNERGWEVKAFEDTICNVVYTKKLQRKDYLENGLIPIISQEDEFISGYWNNVDDAFKVDSPVVIFGDHTRVIKYIDFSFVLGADGVKILKPINDINTRYFFSFLKNCNVPSLGYSRHYKLLKELFVPLPPLSLQQEFAEKIEAIEKQKALVQQSIAETQTLFDSRMDHWFS